MQEKNIIHSFSATALSWSEWRCSQSLSWRHGMPGRNTPWLGWLKETYLHLVYSPPVFSLMRSWPFTTHQGSSLARSLFWTPKKCIDLHHRLFGVSLWGLSIAGRVLYRKKARTSDLTKDILSFHCHRVTQFKISLMENNKNQPIIFYICLVKDFVNITERLN